MAITEDALRSVRDKQTLFRFLHEKMGWPVEHEDLDTFIYDEPDVPGRVSARVTVSRLVPFTSGDPFVIFLAEFARGFRRTDLREVLRGIKKRIREEAAYNTPDLDELVFVCTTENYRGLRFAHFEEKAGRQPRLRVFGFDRDTVGETYTLRNVNLPALQLRENILGEPDWDEAKARWLSAWDVEKVTSAFFGDYKRVFLSVEESIQGVRGDKRLFAQRLFNRLLFVQFLSKKGWLRFGGSTDYLPALREVARANGENFYRDRLYWLFFHGLGTLLDSREAHTLEELRALRGDVPFLNGGLFEMVDADDAQGAVQIPDEAFDRILSELFTCYNFTVTESTPDDIEVAVDPEMLGKVFEELVTGRHESGSYYTPRPVVAFMCREALKGYLGGGDAVARFVDEKDAGGITNPEEVLEALKGVTVVDPACGSGAYLLGMLQELVSLRQCLFATKHVDPISDYKRKLEIIQNNLYGVDKDPFAVNTARLRLWLSLVVDYVETDIAKLPPLPNLDFKIEVGDSLAAPDPQAQTGQVDTRRDLIAQFERAKADYANPFYAGKTPKPELKKRIEALRKDITDWTHPGEKVEGFDWRVEFAEVFEPKEALTTLGGAMNFGQALAEAPRPGGFDIVLANPPYVRQELIREQKPKLKEVFPAVYTGTADLYCYFYARALQLLRPAGDGRPGGMLVFISSNKWFRAGYGANLRKHIADTCSVRSITDFGELPVFETAATFPMIFVAQKGSRPAPLVFTQVKSLAEPYPDVARLVQQGDLLPPKALNGSEWTLTNAVAAGRLRKMEKAGVPLGEYVKGQIYYGVKTGFNTAFVIDGAKRAELIAKDPKSAELIKPLAVGDDVRRWRIETKDRWLIFTRRGVNIDNYLAVKAHLAQWRKQLEPKPRNWPATKEWPGRKPGSYKWYEIQDEVAYYAAFDKPKIVFPDIAKEPRFAFDTTGTYINNTTYFAVTDDLYLVGVLNSIPMWVYCKERLTVLGDAEKGGRLRFFRQFVEMVPIPNASDGDRAVIVGLVQKCLDAKGVGCEEWEREIDERVAALYGL